MYDAVSTDSLSTPKQELIRFPQCITIVIAHEEDGVLMSLLYSCFGVSLPLVTSFSSDDTGLIECTRLGAMISPLAIGAFLDRGYAWNRYYK